MKHYIWDDRDLAIIQGFGENPAAYAQFKVTYSNGGVGPMLGHNGVDIGAWTGTRIRAAEDGTVIEVSSDPAGYGLTVYLMGDSGRGWRHGHFSRIDVAQSQRVSRGDVLGLSGNSGNSSGPHLHLGMRPANPNGGNGYGGYVDPMPVLNELLAQEEDVSRVAELEAALAERDGIITELGNQGQALRAEIDGLNGINTELNNQVGALREELESVRASSGDAEAAALREKLRQVRELVAA
jgi:septal ring factor EnvC (AmiA/AmiB activator)